MLDEAESSLVPANELRDDEDAIDRLLMDAGFDTDDATMQTETKKHVHDVKDAELDELLGFDSFGDDLNEPKKTQTAVGLEPAVSDSHFVPSNEPDDEDAIDRLLMNAGFDADNASVQSDVEDAGADEGPDDFPDFSDFNEPDMDRQESPPTAAVEGVDDEPQAAATSSAAAVDELDEFLRLSFGDDFDESDLIQDDAVAESAPADLIAPAEESGVEEDVGALDELDDFSDFSDFNEPEIVPAHVVEQATEGPISDVDEPAPAVADLTASAAVEDSSAEEEAGEDEELDHFSDFSDFNEPETAQAGEADKSEQAAENLFADVDEPAPAVADSTVPAEIDDEPDAEEDAGAGLADEIDDFSVLSDAFDESDLIQDDEVAASAVAEIADESGAKEDAGEGLADEIDDFSGFSDDFEVSELVLDDAVAGAADLMPPNEEQQTVVEESFNDLQDDENNIDSLLMDAGFEAEDATDQTVGKKDAFGDDADLSEIDDFFHMDEVSDDASWQAEGVQIGETEESSAQGDDFLLPDFDITADMEFSDTGINAGNKDDDVFGDTGFLGQDEAVQGFDTGTSEPKSGDAEPQSKQAADPAIEEVKLNPFGFEQEDIKKQLEDAENKVKKAKLFSYVALGFGAVALSAAAVLGVMMYGAKTEVAKLNAEVSTLEASLAKNAANNPNEEINAMRNSVVQLNQQVNGLITELKGNPQFPVDLLNNKVPDIVAKQDMVSKALDMLQVKMGGPAGKTASEPAVAEPPKAEPVHEHEPAPAPAASTPVKEVKTQETAPVKAAVEHAPAKETLAPAKDGAAAHKTAQAKEKVAHEPVPAPVPAKVEAVPETAPAKVKTQPEAIKAKPVTAEKVVSKQEPVKERKPETPGKWGVNLVAFKQEWFAKSKAAEFARQGIFAEVIPVHEKNTTMYRLRVGGFKSKQEARANTDRIKKTLNLDSVWVSDN
ncbi:MAG: SPOR domain-containing protein [Methylobacter sp.]|nr:SPOR domain-containing protein [Methylobacter sp.]